MVLDNLVLHYVKDPTVTKDDIDALQVKVKGKIRQPPTPFSLFLRRNRQLIRKQQPSLKGAREISRLLGVIWRSLPTHVRDLYNHCALQLRMIHAKLFPDFKYVEKKINQEEDEYNPADNAAYGWIYLTQTGHDDEDTEPIAAKRARLFGAFELNDTSNEPLLRKAPVTSNLSATELLKNTPDKVTLQHMRSTDINKNEKLPISCSFSNPTQIEGTSASEDGDVKAPQNQWVEALGASNSFSELLYTSDSALNENGASLIQMNLTECCISSSFKSSSSLPLGLMSTGENNPPKLRKRKASPLKDELELSGANAIKQPKMSSTPSSSSISPSEASFSGWKSLRDELEFFKNRVSPSYISLPGSILKPVRSRETLLISGKDNEEPLTSSTHSVTFSPFIEVNAYTEAGRQYSPWLQALVNNRSSFDDSISPLYSNLCTPLQNESSPNYSFYPEEIMRSFEKLSPLKSYYSNSNDARSVSNEFADKQLGTVIKNVPSASAVSALKDSTLGSTPQFQDSSKQNMSTDTQIQSNAFNYDVSSSKIPNLSPNNLQQKAAASDCGEVGEMTSPDGVFFGFEEYSPAQYDNFATFFKQNGNVRSPFTGDTPPVVLVASRSVIWSTPRSTPSTNVTESPPTG